MMWTLLLLIPVMALTARAAGADWLGVKGLWGMLFGVIFGLACWLSYGHWGYGIAGALVSWRAFEMGHGTFYNMAGYQDHNRDPDKADQPRVQSLEKFVRPLYVGVFKGDINKPLYSWVCMGAKGLLIGLSMMPFGLALAVLWPVSYWVSRKVLQHVASAEWISGAMAGLIIAIQLGVKPASADRLKALFKGKVK